MKHHQEYPPRRSSRRRRAEIAYPTDLSMSGYNWNHCFLARAILDDTSICHEIRRSPTYRLRLYSTLCNNIWQSGNRIQLFGFRATSELITQINKMDDDDDGPYLSMNEGVVSEDIKKDLDRIGYILVEMPPHELYPYLDNQNFNIARQFPIWKKLIWFTAYDHDIVVLGVRIEPEIYLTQTEFESVTNEDISRAIQLLETYRYQLIGSEKLTGDLEYHMQRIFELNSK